MDVLYIIGDGSRWNNNELRYSLRSLSANAIHLGRVFLCAARRPEWMSTDTTAYTWVPYAQPGKMPAINVLSAMSYAIHNSDLSDDFLLCNDDFFYTRPTDFDAIPYYTKGQLPMQVDTKYGSPSYCQTLINTREILLRHGLPTTNFAHHCCTHFNRQLFVWAEHDGIWRDVVQRRLGASMVTIMANIILYTQAIEAGRYSRTTGEFDRWLADVVKMRKDVKVRHCIDRADLLSQIGDSECFSIADSAIHEGVADYLQELFPTPSIYER